MTANEKKLFASRPKTVKAMFQKLRKAGIDTEFLELGKSMDSHRAPLGTKISWSNPAPLPAFSGRLICKPVKGFDYSGYRKPWEALWWVYSGTGGGDGKGNWTGGFTIWCSDVPEVTKEWKAAAKASQEAVARVNERWKIIDLEKAEAEILAGNEVLKRHGAAVSMLNGAADEATSEFMAWKKRNLVWI